MFHKVDIAINQATGLPMSNVLIRLFDPSSGDIIDMFADESGTPIETASGIANTAITDATGTYDFWVNDGIYDMEFSVGTALLRRVRRFYFGTTLRAADYDEATPDDASEVVFDDGAGLKRAPASSFADAVVPVASEGEAEDGSDNAKRMTPLRVKQAVDARGYDAAIAARAATADLASTAPGKGAELVLSRLNSAAAERKVADRLADSVSLLDYRLAPDADQNDLGLWLQRAWDNGNRAFYLPYRPSGYNWTTPWDALGFPIWFDGRGNTVTLTGGGVSYLKNTGMKSDVFDLTIIGDRTTGQIFYEGMGATSLANNIRVEQVDIGFKMTGGFEPVFDNIYGRNCRTALFHFADGVGPIVKHFTYDTDGPWYYGKAVASITRSGTTATVTTSANHGFTTGQTVNIMGCTQAAYNGNFVVTVSSATVFTYTVSGSPTTPATAIANGSGTIFASLASSIFAMPTKGAIWLQTEGAVLAGGDSIHGGLVIEVPSYRNIEWALIGGLYLDSGLDNPGAQIINNTADKYVRGLFFMGMWAATNTRGIQISGSASNDRIDGIFISGCHLHNNTSEAIQVDKGQNIFIEGNDIIGNNASVFQGSSYVKSGPANQVLLGTSARNVFVIRNKMRGAAMRWSTTPYEHIFIDAGVTGAAYDNDCDSGTTGGFGVYNVAGTAFRVGYNSGVALPNFSNDAAAASGGTAIGGWYRNGSALMVRQS
ncbi:hypothetical protein M2336_001656 [Sphingobium sp. B1D7B]|uniref:hypothetical protein n=1 Tax=Sphingobium sp. B1D7B TaxID=2940578 RepID=UPI00222522AF|nr:hypothetical protein [Sphingobium sp. B1D7B]MCW2405027.1 hypothetical protein [Sphingobium sp. B1D7B]